MSHLQGSLLTLPTCSVDKPRGRFLTHLGAYPTAGSAARAGIATGTYDGSGNGGPCVVKIYGLAKGISGAPITLDADGQLEVEIGDNGTVIPKNLGVAVGKAISAATAADQDVDVIIYL
jgi:hypothetical protein